MDRLYRPHDRSATDINRTIIIDSLMWLIPTIVTIIWSKIPINLLLSRAIGNIIVQHSLSHSSNIHRFEGSHDNMCMCLVSALCYCLRTLAAVNLRIALYPMHLRSLARISASL